MDSGGAVYAKVPAEGVAVLEAAVKEARLSGRSSSPLGVLAYDPALHTFAKSRLRFMGSGAGAEASRGSALCEVIPCPDWAQAGTVQS